MSLRDQLPRDSSCGVRADKVTGALAQHREVQGSKIPEQ